MNRVIPILTTILFGSLVSDNSQKISISDTFIESPIRIMFWNLRTFGEHRASDEIGRQLYQISSEYDILLFAEIRDSDCNTHPTCPLSKFFEKYFPEYQLFLSPSLHYCSNTHSGSEEYAMLVRRSISFDNISMIHYEDKDCIFIRRPYGLKISKNQMDYHLLLFHSNPNNQKELVSLSNVFHQLGDQRILLLGDLNTGCHYVSFETLNAYEIRKNYDWLLSEKSFTNVEQTCPYDRIISTKDISSHLRNQKVLNENNEAHRINSDHYPISVEWVF
jgi:hypothetical protein